METETDRTRVLSLCKVVTSISTLPQSHNDRPPLGQTPTEAPGDFARTLARNRQAAWRAGSLTPWSLILSVPDPLGLDPLGARRGCLIRRRGQSPTSHVSCSTTCRASGGESLGGGRRRLGWITAPSTQSRLDALPPLRLCRFSTPPSKDHGNQRSPGRGSTLQSLLGSPGRGPDANRPMAPRMTSTDGGLVRVALHRRPPSQGGISRLVVTCWTG
ncbi:hypothetical protein BKA56DRAFT_587484 [Ilyonectria sp. MPI-CAGE-AT-0026]|nr:hypothetical protein BKA56DRAFT_587484 [Ilyonectria sp. MPI-CAGE-AT-0026]